MELRAIENLLNQEGLTTQFRPASADEPLDQLLVLLDLEQHDVQLMLELLYVPDTDDQFDHIRLLQFFVMLPFEIENNAVREALRQHILQVNINLPLMGFGLHEQNGYAYFRHVLALPKETSAADSSVITETTWLVYYLVNLYYAELAAAAN